jgi:hypothetical protein
MRAQMGSKQLGTELLRRPKFDLADRRSQKNSLSASRDLALLEIAY